MNKTFVKPGAGRLVRYSTDPRRVLLPAGDFVPRDSYWLRRIADGDVVESTPPAVKKGKES